MYHSFYFTMSFYITLPSDSISNENDNTQSNYTTKLATPLNFKIPYEVALVEISYREFMEIDIGKIHLVYFNQDNITISHTIPLFAYDNEPIEHFVERINTFLIIESRKYINSQLEILKKSSINTNIISNKIEEHNNVLTMLTTTSFFNYDPTNRKIKIEENQLNDVQLEGYIVNVLCNNFDTLNDNQKLSIKAISDVTTLKVLPEYFNFIDQMLVYCNIIDYQLIGDVKAPVLRTVIKTGAYNTTTEKIYNDPHYVDVSKSYIPSINIKLMDSTGNLIKFGSKNSKVFCKLHFKPKQYE